MCAELAAPRQAESRPKEFFIICFWGVYKWADPCGNLIPNLSFSCSSACSEPSESTSTSWALKPFDLSVCIQTPWWLVHCTWFCHAQFGWQQWVSFSLLPTRKLHTTSCRFHGLFQKRLHMEEVQVLPAALAVCALEIVSGGVWDALYVISWHFQVWPHQAWPQPMPVSCKATMGMTLWLVSQNRTQQAVWCTQALSDVVNRHWHRWQAKQPHSSNLCWILCYWGAFRSCWFIHNEHAVTRALLQVFVPQNCNTGSVCNADDVCIDVAGAYLFEECHSSHRISGSNNGAK